MKSRSLIVCLAGLTLMFISSHAFAQGGDISLLSVVNHGDTQEYSVKLQVLILMTLVGLLPTLVLMMTCFT